MSQVLHRDVTVTVSLYSVTVLVKSGGNVPVARERGGAWSHKVALEGDVMWGPTLAARYLRFGRLTLHRPHWNPLGVVFMSLSASIMSEEAMNQQPLKPSGLHAPHSQISLQRTPRVGSESVSISGPGGT